MKIGLPSALLNPYYITFWKTFFERLGLEVVMTPETTKAILDKGVRHTVPEICVPIKIYTGHVVDLLDRAVDRIYVPRFVSIRQGDAFCPKFLGLPDMLKCIVPNLQEKLITHHIKAENDNIATDKNYFSIGKMFTDDKGLIRQAIQCGREKWQAFRNLCCNEHYNCKMANDMILNGRNSKSQDTSIRIGVIGYIYNIYDSFISMNILNRLTDLGAQAITFEMLQQSQFEKELKHFGKTLFWTFSNKLLAGAYSFFEDPTIDGVIHVTAFGCGPDSFLGKYLELDSDRVDKPFMTIRVDEHTGENHLQTRVEAFVDMIAKKKRGKETA
jgi:predicted nucleotide-binding protein (sugar kinase/HSP70/actin superfamily)